MPESDPADMPVWAILLIPIGFAIVFPLFWCFIMWINSRVSGWSRLADYYRSDTQDPPGKVFDSVHGRVGLVSYRGVLQCVAVENGLYIQPGFLFKFAHPMLFIPWTEFHQVRQTHFLWLRMVRARVGNPHIGSMILAAKVFEESEGRKLLQ